MPIDLLKEEEPFEPGTNNTNLNQDEIGILYETVDRMCSVISSLETQSGGKTSKILEFSVEFCNNYGVAHESVPFGVCSKLQISLEHSSCY